MPEVKDFIVPAILSVCCILFIAACATSWADFGNAFYGFFEACTDFGFGRICVTGSFLGCSSADSTRQAAAAFLVITTIILAVAAILAVARLYVAVLANGPAKIGVIACIGVCIFFGLLAWAISFGLYGGKYCGVKYTDINGFKIGPSPILSLLAWLGIIAAFVAELILNKPIDSAPDAK